MSTRLALPPSLPLHQSGPDPEAPRWSGSWRMRSRDLGVLLRGGSVLAITGFCIAAFLVQLVASFRSQGGSVHDFVNRNQLDAQARMQILGWLGAGAAGGAITALAQYFWGFRRRSSVARASRVLRTARLVCPLMLPGLAWPL